MNHNDNVSFLQNFKMELLQTDIIGNLIKTPDTICVVIAGSQILSEGQDQKSDIDLVCYTKHIPDTQQALYHLKYKNRIVHWDYQTIDEGSTLTTNFTERSKGLYAGAIEGVYARPYILYLDPSYQVLGDCFNQYREELFYIATYKMFNLTFPIYNFNPDSYYIPHNKLMAYLLLSYYHIINQEPDGNLFLKLKRSKKIQFQDEKPSDINNQFLKKVIQFLYNFIMQHPFNISAELLKINSEITKLRMEVEKIEENKPYM